MKKLHKLFNFIYNKNGMSLIEVTIAGSMMALLGLASMKLAENNSKTQKKMNFNSQLSQLKLTTNIQLRKGESCLKNLSGDPNTTESFIIAGGIDSPTPETCKTQGKIVPELYDQKGNVFLKTGEIYGKGSGAAYTVKEIRTALPDKLPGTAVVCVKVELNGTQTLGSREKWITEVLDLQGVIDVNNVSTVNSCNAESVADTEDSCKTFNGTLNNSLGCEGLDIGYPGSEIIKNTADFNDAGNSNFKEKRIKDAAINALGNMGVSNNLHVCGNISVGSMSSGSFPVKGDMNDCDSAGIYTNSLMAESVFSKSLVTENLNATGSIKLTGGATVDSLRVNGNASVSGDLQVNGQTIFSKVIKSENGIDNTNRNINTKTINLDGNLIYADKSTNTIYLNAKVKAKHHDGTYTGLDSLVTHSWVYENLVTKMSDQAINELLRTIFNKISSESWSSTSSLHLVKDFVSDRLTIENETDSSYLNGSALATDNVIPGTDSCPTGFSVVKVKFEGAEAENQLPGKIKYYCRSNADSGSQTKKFLRITGEELQKFRYAENTAIFDCDSTINQVPIGAYCYKLALICLPDEGYWNTLPPIAQSHCRTETFAVPEGEGNNDDEDKVVGERCPSIFPQAFADGSEVVSTNSKLHGSWTHSIPWYKFSKWNDPNANVEIMKFKSYTALFLIANNSIYKSAKAPGSPSSGAHDFMANYNDIPTCLEAFAALISKKEPELSPQFVTAFINWLIPPANAANAPTGNIVFMNQIDTYKPVRIYLRLK